MKARQIAQHGDLIGKFDAEIVSRREAILKAAQLVKEPGVFW